MNLHRCFLGLCTVWGLERFTTTFLRMPCSNASSTSGKRGRQTRRQRNQVTKEYRATRFARSGTRAC
eukprot:4670498-Amphidinium_carterae.1